MINGKRYIGQKMFLNGWQKYLGSGTHFLRAVKNYGKENFSREIIGIAYSKEELDQLEITCIREHNAVKDTDYYNFSSGGDSPMSGLKMSDEAKQKLRNINLGKHHTEETKQKLRMKNKNQYVSPETRRKMSLGKINSINSKSLNKIQATEIRVKYTNGISQRKLAKEYKTTQGTITRVVNYKGIYKII